MNMKAKQITGLFLVGGIGYALIEILWRGRTHWTMALTGGTVFISLSRLRGRLASLPISKRCAAGAACITTAELLVGMTVNRLMRMNVWDYSREKLNVAGQICIKYTMLWFFLSAPAMEIGQTCAKWLAKPRVTRYNAIG